MILNAQTLIVLSNDIELRTLKFTQTRKFFYYISNFIYARHKDIFIHNK